MNKTYCLVSAQYLPTMGGVENFTYNLSKQLIKNGNRCIVITSSLPNLSDFEIDENGIEIIRLDTYNLLNNRFPFIKFNKKNSKILNNLLKYDNLQFIINTRIYPLSLLIANFTNKHNIKSFIIEHGSYYLTFNNKILDFFLKIYEHILIKLIFRKCKTFYGVSDASCKWLETFNIKSKGVIPNGIDLNRVETVDKNSLDLSMYNIKPNSKIICYAGRLIPEKGVDKLCVAFKELNFKNSYLFFAGEGNLYNFINENKNENTFLLGKLDFDKVISLFKQSDIFCLPTVSEGFPTTVLEASCADCYTITTSNSGGATQIIKNDISGTIIENNDITLIKNAISNAFLDDKLKDKAKKSKEIVINNYTWQVIAKKIEDLN